MQARSDRRWLFVVIAVVIADVVASFETLMVVATLKALFKEFRDPAGVGWMVTAYLLVGAASAAVCGRLGDLFGRKRMIVLTLAIATAGSLVSALHDEIGWVIAGRALQGISAAVFPLSYGILRNCLPPERMATAGGLLMSSNAIGAMAGLMIGGLIVDYFSWRAVFLTSVGFTLFAIAVALLWLPAEATARKTMANIDLLGGILFAPAVAGLLLVVSKGAAWGLTDARTIAIAAGSLVLFAWWVRHELNHPDPLLDVRLLIRRDIALSNLVMALSALGPLQLTIVMMLLLQQSPATGIGLGMTASAAAAVKMPANLCSFVGGPIAGHFCATISERAVIQFGMALNMVCWTMLFFVHQNAWLVFVAVLLSTIGTTVAYVGVANKVTFSAPAGRTSEANGVTIAVRSIVNACGAQIVTLMLGGAVLSEQTQASAALAPSGYYKTFAFILVFSAASLVVARALSARRGEPDESARDEVPAAA